MTAKDSPEVDSSQIFTLAREWLKQLLRIDTSNPPGKEQAGIAHLQKLLQQYGIESRVVADQSGRPNLFFERKAAGCAEEDALLLSSHIDVVPVADADSWRYPPFAGVEAEGSIWGRGAVDMKYKTAFDFAAFISLLKSPLRRTLKVVVLCDEEANCEHGSKFLCAQHAELIRARWVLNEVGGYTMNIGARQFVFVQAAEKGTLHVRMTAFGNAGHASIDNGASSVVFLARAISQMNTSFFDYCCRPCTQQLLRSVAEDRRAAEPILAALMDALQQPAQAQAALKAIPDPMLAGYLRAMLTNSAQATMLSAGFKVNVIPPQASAQLDCRLMPGQDPEQFVARLATVLAQAFPEQKCPIQLEILDFDPGYEVSLQGQAFEAIKQGVQRCWGKDISPPPVVPYLMPASSDNSQYHRAGILPIGFAPLLAGPGEDVLSLAHARDERVPVAAFEKGLELYLDVVRELVL
jgi:acetylornithine deacetylase/succinyl-diaminopimelate desuccinylase-like protein